MSASFLERERELIKLNAEIDFRFTKPVGLTNNVVKIKGKQQQSKPSGDTNEMHNILKIDEIDCVKAYKLDLNSLGDNVFCDPVVIPEEINEPRNTDGLSPKGVENVIISTMDISKLNESKLKKTEDILKESTISNSKGIGKHLFSNASCVLPKKNISNEGMIRFLKSKTMILQQELDMLKRENNTRIEEMNALIESKKKSDSLKAHTIARNNFLQSQLQKSEEKRNEALLKCKERDTELTALKKSLEEVKRDVKQKTQANINLEKRVQQLVSESEILKTEISKLKEYEKEYNKNFLMEKKFFEDQIELLNKQRIELVHAFKKQLLLIDNLKRQNICLEKAKLLEFVESDFVKMLNSSK